MTTSRGKVLSDWTESEIYESLEEDAKVHSYQREDLVSELDRRESRKTRGAVSWLTWAAAASAVVSAIAAVIALFKP